MTLTGFSRVSLVVLVQTTHRGLQLENNDIYDLGVHCLRRGCDLRIAASSEAAAPVKNACFLYFFRGEGNGKLWNFLHLTFDTSLGHNEPQHMKSYSLSGEKQMSSWKRQRLFKGLLL